MSGRRLAGVVVKETRQIVRDPSSVAIAFVLPMLLLFLFGYGVSLDAEDVPIAIVVEDPTPESESLAAGFVGSPYFDPVRVVHRRVGEAMMRRGAVRAVVVVREDFDRAVARHRAGVQVLVDGTDTNTARLVVGYAEGVWRRWLEARARDQGRTLPVAIRAEQRIWFNPEVRSRNFLVPGLVAIVMTLTGALLTSLLIAREYDRGTIETLIATPVTVPEILLGKLVPTFVLGMASMALTVAMAVALFGVPLRGSVLVLTAVSALFLLASLGMGMVISTTTKDQFVAGMVAIVVTFLPAFLLSGFLFNIDAMPQPVRLLTYAVAARYFVDVLQTLFLVGTEWAVIVPNAAALAAIAVAFLTMARLLLKKRLD